MRIGSLVKRIEFGYIGVIVRPDPDFADYWLVHFSDGVIRDRWCSECELEVVCK